MNDVVVSLINIGLVLVLSLGFFAWILRGFLVPYLRVRSSRGAKVLVKVRNPLIDYYKVGEPEGKVVLIKLRKNKKLVEIALNIPSSAFYRTLGVVCVDLDEESGAVVTRDYKIVSSLDPVVWNNMYKRSLTAPRTEKTSQMIILVLLVLVLLVVLFLAFKLNSLSEVVFAMNNVGVGEIGGVAI